MSLLNDTALRYEELKKQKEMNEIEVLGVIHKATELLENLSGDQYLRWTGHQLQEFEIRLARYAEYLGTQAAAADGKYTFFEDKYKQQYLILHRENKRQLQLKQEKVTNTDVDSITTEQLAEFQDKVNILYEYFRYLKSYVESLERYLLAIAHRLRELDSERKH